MTIYKKTIIRFIHITKIIHIIIISFIICITLSCSTKSKSSHIEKDSNSTIVTNFITCNEFLKNSVENIEKNKQTCTINNENHFEIIIITNSLLEYTNAPMSYKHQERYLNDWYHDWLINDINIKQKDIYEKTHYSNVGIYIEKKYDKQSIYNLAIENKSQTNNKINNEAVTLLMTFKDKYLISYIYKTNDSLKTRDITWTKILESKI